jgi:hypothetical protein
MSFFTRWFGGGGESTAQVPSRCRSDELDGATALLQERTLGAFECPANDLLRDHPPVLHHPNKRIVFDLALAGRHDGIVAVRRVDGGVLPEHWFPWDVPTRHTTQRGYFPYDADGHWWLNFADTELFGFYGSHLLAQDEIQVAEHPLLACVREAMTARTDGLAAKTTHGGFATPVLVEGVQRRVSIDTGTPNRPTIYGSRFAAAVPKVVRASCMVLSSPTVSNILAMEAPRPGSSGRYRSTHIHEALSTAFAGFHAACLSSWSQGNANVVIHTGWWGCGAFGGNRQLMYSIQRIAADLAGVSELVFHCGDGDLSEVEGYAASLSAMGLVPGVSIGKVVSRLAAQGFQWGVSDGN